MKNFRTYELAKAFYFNCSKLKFKQPMKDQFDRALLSVVLNISEGSGKRTNKERRNFYSIALGSMREVQCILDLSGQAEFLKESDPIAACLFRLIQNPGPTNASFRE